MKLLPWLLLLAAPVHAGTVALWLFDEPSKVYPSTALNDASGHGLILILGRGAKLVPGHSGNALEAADPEPLTIGGRSRNANFGLVQLPTPEGRTIAPMTWQTATFAALLTSGETHLRTPGFANATDTKLNLGGFDWTVEFWFSRTGATPGTVFEIGEGPRGENNRVTRLSVNPARSEFVLENRTRLAIPSRIDNGWHHFAFVYTAREQQLRHYVDGALQKLPAQAKMEALQHGEEAYFTVARDGRWEHPLPGRIDELRFSDHSVYTAAFTPAKTFSTPHVAPKLAAGPPLLFEHPAPVIELGSRKHLFLDEALIAESRGIAFVPNPPRRAEKVLDDVHGHLSMVDDGELLRLYYRGPGDCLQVMTSRDGVHWEKPENNTVVKEPTALGNVFIDPNAPPESRWKYVSGIRKRAIFVFSSPDGYHFTPHETAALPFSAGSQSNTYYDDQRQVYASHHRSDYGATQAGHTERRFVLSETKDLLSRWPFEYITPARTAEVAKQRRIQSFEVDPWFLDNGPLTPPGIGIELPTVIGHDDRIDEPGVDIYTTKVVKYPWAPDAYVAFPAVYFHYRGDGPPARQALDAKERMRGSGVTEVQLAVSRDGRNYQRYPRPAYVPIGGDGSNSVHMFFMTHGLARRGNEIWQYVGGHDGNGIGYHSTRGQKGPWPLYRLVQRLDGFVAAEAPYSGGTMQTKPLTFTGNRLKLNIDTGATGWAQVGLIDESGAPIPGYSLDDCIYINGDFIDTPVEWSGHKLDVSALAGKTVRVVFRMRGAKLFAMQFTQE